ncbi:biotin--[acetyl-CoA-carboxylase] ligase [Kineosporia sp. R_H_3]|uniref:biotin--[acetyl-CoA-carboxylase] ligase n=1 Tax=Kineosporia sp. R_H_3 TaxID=1961848 RepID=UPI000B4BBB11|nr:biotin--[acetyl-CoA-carboxylase] ligase [Kineosporia sp. R_H_3]
MDDASPWSDLGRPPLSQAALRRAVTQGTGATWRALDVLPRTASTNADALARAADGEPEGLVVVTDHQTAGRGRLDRTWETPARAALAVSVLLRPGTPSTTPDGEDLPVVAPEHWSWLPLLTGVAAHDALVRTCGLTARLKWPNDVLVPRDGRPGAEAGKVCGILAELASTPSGIAVVVGAGINVTQTAQELPVPTATSLALAGSATTDRDTVLRAYLRALSDRYRAWRRAAGDPRASGIAAAYREACATIGLEVAVELPGGVVRGVADGVDDAGQLLVRDASGAVRALAAGDVVHVRPSAASSGSG